MDLRAGSAERISVVSVAGAKASRWIFVCQGAYTREAEDVRGWFKSSLCNENVFDSFRLVRYPLH